MGNIKAKFVRPARTYNIVERAERVISREKPTPAPAYPSTMAQKKIADKVDPDFMKNHYKQDPALHDRLKQIFVTSNAQIAEEERNTDKLPQDTKGSKEWDYGFWQPTKARKEKVLLKDALKFMADNTTDPVKNDPQAIVNEYKLAQKDVENILKYYRVLQVLLPQEKTYEPKSSPRKPLAEIFSKKSLDDALKKLKS